MEAIIWWLLTLYILHMLTNQSQCQHQNSSHSMLITLKRVFATDMSTEKAKMMSKNFEIELEMMSGCLEMSRIKFCWMHAMYAELSIFTLTLLILIHLPDWRSHNSRTTFVSQRSKCHCDFWDSCGILSRRSMCSFVEKHVFAKME